MTDIKSAGIQSAKALCLAALVLSSAGCDQSGPGTPQGAKPQSDISGNEVKQPPQTTPVQSGQPEVAPSPGIQSGPAAAPSASPAFTSVAEIHEYIKNSNTSYTLGGQFELSQDGQVIAAALPACQISNISFLKDWPLIQVDLSNNPISDLSPIRGKKSLKSLYLENTEIRDISALYGLPLVELYLSNTPVVDIMPLAEMPLENLNLLGTGVYDLLPLARSPIRMLWLSETPVSDVTPLIACPIESLTLHRTPVSDISPLAGTGIQRLHIGETEVTDITPVLGMRLNRLIFTPSKIESGLEQIRQHPFLREVGTSFETRMAPAQFWDLFDQGQLP